MFCLFFFGLSFKEESSSGLAITFFTVHVVHVRGTNSFSTLIVSGYFNPFESSETICTSRDGLTIIRRINRNAIIKLYFIPSDLSNNRADYHN